jgi:CHAT domain-containing protein
MKTLSIFPILLSTILLAANPAQAESAAELTQQGKLAYDRGQFQTALTQWQRATQLYQKAQNPTGITGSYLNQAQALTAMGMHRRACKTLITALQIPSPQSNQLCEIDFSTDPITTPTLPTPQLKTTGLHQLGETLRLIGNLERSQQILFQAQQSTPAAPQANLLLSLGNTARDIGTRERNRTDELAYEATSYAPQGKICSTPATTIENAIEAYQVAIDCYKQSAAQAPNELTKLQANLNQLSLSLEVAQWLKHSDQSTQVQPWLQSTQSAQTIDQIRKDLSSIPFSYEMGYIRINFARSLVQWSQLTNASTEPEAKKLLESTLNLANIDNNRTIASYAIAQLGWLHEQRKDWPTALTLTQQALQENSQASPDVLYQWQWQAARILRQQNNPTESVAAYTRAITLLESARKDVQSINPDAQFALRDNVEPVYRELIDLQLKQPNPDYNQIIKYIDALQLAELENFLRCRLSPTGNATATTIAKDESAAIFYTVILDDRLEVIASLPTGKFHREKVAIPKPELRKHIKETVDALKRPEAKGDDYKALTENLYDQIIRPFQAELRDSKTKTLVFVSDGDLREIPMATLRDAQTNQFLIDQYPIAITPGLNILGAKSYPRNQLKALIGGLTDTTPSSFTIKGKSRIADPLSAVRPEVEAIARALPKSKVLIDRQFNPTQLKQELQATSYPVIHLATHGKFSSDPQQTYILTSNNNIINVNAFQEIINQRRTGQSSTLDLLVFSACQTATGDRRATLGMAGVAIRAGASSTIATLWSVDDMATQQLMTQFYDYFTKNPTWTKAEALQKAQQALKQSPETEHPAYWAGFTLVGNWR